MALAFSAAWSATRPTLPPPSLASSMAPRVLPLGSSARRAFCADGVGGMDCASRGCRMSASPPRANRPAERRSFKTASMVAEEPEALRGWVRWRPKEGVFHPALCVEVKKQLHALDWKYAAKPPRSKLKCPHCAALIDVSRKTLDGDPLVDFISAQGWARDYFTAPDPAKVLGSFPARLPPALLVDVSYNTVECMLKMVKEYVPICDDGDRQPAYFIRSGPGWGKTFNLQEVLVWLIMCSVDFERWCLAASDGQTRRDLRLQQEKVVTQLLMAGGLGLARSVSAFGVNFNGNTAFNVAELALTQIAGPGVLASLRVCYTELVDPKKVLWPTFLEKLTSAVKANVLSMGDVNACASAILAFCRGQPGGIPLLVVDEVAKVKSVSLTHDAFDIGQQPYAADEQKQPYGADVEQARGADEKQPGGANGNKRGHDAFRTVDDEDRWVDAVCSEACGRLQSLGGMVLYSTLLHATMRRESTRSGRDMLPAMKLSYLEPTAFASALVVELLPLYAEGVAVLLGTLLQSGELGDGPRSSAFVLLLCSLLGGHPRLVGKFLLKLRNAVAALVKNGDSSTQQTIFSSTLQRVCMSALSEAVSSSSVGATLGSLGGAAGLQTICTEVLLGRRVRLDCVAVHRIKRGVAVPVLWDELGGDGIVLLQDRQPVGSPGSDRNRRDRRPVGSSDSDSNYAFPSLHPMLALRMAFQGGYGVRYDAFREMLLCPGSRHTGERLERVIANWCVLSSYARSDHPRYYSSVSLRSLWSRPSLAATDDVDGDRLDQVLDKVHVNASAARTSGVQDEKLLDVLKFATMYPQDAINAVFRLNPNAARRLQVAVDVVEFFPVTQAFGRFKLGDIIAIVYSVKDWGVGASGSPSLAHVNQGWKLLEAEFQEEDGLWSRWKDNIVFVYANRRPGKFGVKINSQSRKEYDAGRAAGRLSVLLSDTDLSGWLPDFMPTFLNASQYLQQAGVSEKTLSKLGSGDCA